MEVVKNGHGLLHRGAAIAALLLDRVGSLDDVDDVEYPAEIVTPDYSHAGELLSPSQVRCFTGCAQRWAYKYLEGIPEVTTAALVVGGAVHEAVAENSRQKIATREDLPVEHVVASFVDAFERRMDTVGELREKDSPMALRATGAGLIGVYMADVAPGIRPAAVEVPVSGELGGVKVRGFLDLIEEDGTVRELKTAVKSPCGIDGDHRMQASTYAQFADGASGLVKLDTLVKNKTPKAVAQSWRISGADLHWCEAIYPAVQRAMRTGVYLPNRSGHLCSRELCSYWRRCEERHGSRVRGGVDDGDS